MRHSRTFSRVGELSSTVFHLSPNVFGIYARAAEIQALIKEGASVQADWPLPPAAHSGQQPRVDLFWR